MRSGGYQQDICLSRPALVGVASHNWPVKEQSGQRVVVRIAKTVTYAAVAGTVHSTRRVGRLCRRTQTIKTRNYTLLSSFF